MQLIRKLVNPGACFTSVCRRLLIRAERVPDTPLFSWVDDHGAIVETVSHIETVARVDAVRRQLRKSGVGIGECVLLVFPPSLHFHWAFLGCMAAGAVPVPVYPPSPARLESDLPKFLDIAKDCGARVALTSSTFRWAQRWMSFRGLIGRQRSWPDLSWIITSRLEASTSIGDFHDPDPAEPAVLQYTSGSTSSPKGVRITHGNIQHQLEMNRTILELTEQSRSVLWVPPYHDFGLISGITSAAWGNGHLYMMSPLTFLRSPWLWMEVISEVRATHAPAPNFAYALLLKKTTPKQRLRWDLSSLQVLMSAAEPIQPDLMERFFSAFEPTGLKREAFCPAYGLAEHTVGVTLKGKRILRARRADLEHDGRYVPAGDEEESLDLVGCGTPWSGIEVRIVDPHTRCPRAEGAVGEIWVSSDSVADGYHQRPQETDAAFGQICDEGNSAYLRTGDLGLLVEGELFVTGRLKDLIIIQGRNVYPQDLERSLEAANASLRPGCSAVFGIEQNGKERVVAVVEVQDRAIAKANLHQLKEELCKIVRQEHMLQLHRLVIGTRGLVPKTSSGKVQRAKARSMLMDGTMEHSPAFVTQQAWQSPSKEPANLPVFTPSNPSCLEDWLMAAVQRHLGDSVCPDPEEKLSTYLDSLQIAELIATLDDELDGSLPLQPFYELPMRELAQVIQRCGKLPPRILDEARRPGSRLVTFVPRESGVWPVTDNQRAMWSLHQLNPECDTVVRALKIRGPFSTEVFITACSELLRRHPVLRSTYHTVHGSLVAKVSSNNDFHVACEDASRWTANELKARLVDETRRTFNLEKGPLFRCTALQRAENEHLLLFALHHIICDAETLQVLLEELTLLYEAAQRGENAELPQGKWNFFDYADWETKMLASDAWDQQWKFWQDHLVSHRATELAAEERIFDTAVETLKLPPKVTEMLYQYVKQEHTTPYQILLATIFLLRYEETGDAAALVHSTCSLRDDPELQRVIGPLFNYFVLAGTVEPDMKFSQLVVDTRKLVSHTFRNRALPYATIARRTGLPWAGGKGSFLFTFARTNNEQQELFNTFVVGVKGKTLSIGNLILESFPLPRQVVPYDRYLSCTELRKEIILGLKYSTARVSASDAGKSLKRLGELLERALMDPEAIVAKILSWTGESGCDGKGQF